MNRQGPKRNLRWILTVFLSFGPLAQEPVAEAVLRDPDLDRAVGGFQFVDDDVAIGGGGTNSSILQFNSSSASVRLRMTSSIPETFRMRITGLAPKCEI